MMVGLKGHQKALFGFELEHCGTMHMKALSTAHCRSMLPVILGVSGVAHFLIVAYMLHVADRTAHATRPRRAHIQIHLQRAQRFGLLEPLFYLPHLLVCQHELVLSAVILQLCVCARAHTHTHTHLVLSAVILQLCARARAHTHTHTWFWRLSFCSCNSDTCPRTLVSCI